MNNWHCSFLTNHTSHSASSPQYADTSWNDRGIGKSVQKLDLRKPCVWTLSWKFSQICQTTLLQVNLWLCIWPAKMPLATQTKQWKIIQSESQHKCCQNVCHLLPGWVQTNRSFSLKKKRGVDCLCRAKDKDFEEIASMALICRGIPSFSRYKITTTRLKKQQCTVSTCIYIYMGVSKNSGTPKWMVYNEKPY